LGADRTDALGSLFRPGHERYDFFSDRPACPILAVFAKPGRTFRSAMRLGRPALFAARLVEVDGSV
jgi:hypothetical protein